MLFYKPLYNAIFGLGIFQSVMMSMDMMPFFGHALYHTVGGLHSCIQHSQGKGYFIIEGLF